MLAISWTPSFPILQTSPIAAQIDLFICNKGKLREAFNNLHLKYFFATSCVNKLNTTPVCSAQIISYKRRRLFVQRNVTWGKNARRQTIVTLYNTTHVISSSRRSPLVGMKKKGWKVEGREREVRDGRVSPRWSCCSGRMWALVRPHTHIHKNRDTHVYTQ